MRYNRFIRFPSLVLLLEVLLLCNSFASPAFATSLNTTAHYEQQGIPPYESTSCPPTLRWGSEGPLVKELQSVLNLNYSDRRFSNSPYNFHPPLSVDGIFGPLTYKAVVDFQHARFPKNSNEWDGIVGPHTWHALSGEYC